MNSRLPFLIAAALSLAPPSPAVPDASGWTEPRRFHAPFDETFAERLVVRKTATPSARPSDAVASPNNAYWFAPCSAEAPGLTVSADNAVHRILIKDGYANFPVEARWINEKLIFIRVHWGRVLGSDLLFDAERGAFIHKEMVHDGTLLFQQTRRRQAAQP